MGPRGSGTGDRRAKPKSRRPNGGANLMPPEMSDLAGIAVRLPWPRMAAPLATAEDALARLDERLRASPIREGFIARTAKGRIATARAYNHLGRNRQGTLL